MPGVVPVHMDGNDLPQGTGRVVAVHVDGKCELGGLLGGSGAPSAGTAGDGLALGLVHRGLVGGDEGGDRDGLELLDHLAQLLR